MRIEPVITSCSDEIQALGFVIFCSEALVDSYNTMTWLYVVLGKTKYII